MTPGRLKIWNLNADVWQYTPGGSQPWDEHDLSGDVADWTAGNGTWTSGAGVLSQTDNTADGVLVWPTVFDSPDFVVEAEVRFPTGQDSGTTMQAWVTADNPDSDATQSTNFLLGYGALLAGDASGDGAGITVAGQQDGSPGGGRATAVSQGEFHTLRTVCSSTRISVYLDSALVWSGQIITGGNGPSFGSVPGWTVGVVGLGAVGLVDFRNVKVWTRPLPA